ncbi:MAG: hypothetical protein LBR33_10540 [Propionibacteriaceae bacterium]|jgi:hypothetical protein|nr:hypothetical protein [Propionibacteriaceae bacterium]
MTDLADFHAAEPFGLPRAAKRPLLTARLLELTRHHAAQSPAYRRLLDALGVDPDQLETLEDIPFLPVRLFKQFDLRSVGEAEIRAALTSSGTSGQAPSRIYLDAPTARAQTQALARIVATVLGPRRLPALFIDAQATLGDRRAFSARAAGLRGFSVFGRDVTFALDGDLRPDWAAVTDFLERHAGQDLFLFGFTFLVWRFLEAARADGVALDLGRATLIHGGGWKQLADQALTDADFRAGLGETFGLRRVFDYYGMVEQAGSIALQCEAGRLHTSVYSEVLIRRPADFSIAQPGEAGLIEALSALPLSYPGHAVLTEDRGVLLGEDDCACGRQGTAFAVLGRLDQAEVRGCSNVL